MAIYLEEAQYFGQSYMGRKKLTSRLYADPEDQEECRLLMLDIIADGRDYDDEKISKIMYWRENFIGETSFKFFWINGPSERKKLVAAGVTRIGAMTSLAKILEISGELVAK